VLVESGETKVSSLGQARRQGAAIISELEEERRAGLAGKGSTGQSLEAPPQPHTNKNLLASQRTKAQRAAELAARDPRLVGGVQPNQEERAAMAAGVRRSFARAEALAEGEWERLRTEYLVTTHVIKLGRRGATKELGDAVKEAWRTREVVKLRVHDDKSARKSILPRLNLVLRELEEVTGGVLVDVRGTSIWIYR